MRTLAHKHFALVAAVAATLGMVAASPTTAHANSPRCYQDYCTGTDGSTLKDAQDHYPPIYLGEVGNYTKDFEGQPGPCTGDPDQECFNTTAANNAQNAWLNGTGEGTQWYYFGGGWASAAAPSYQTPYCWGWAQGQAMINNGITYFNSWEDNNWLAFLDVEQNSSYGWSLAYQSADRQIFQGFSAYVSGQSSIDSHCPGSNTSWQEQPGAYSSPYYWSYAMGSYAIPNSYQWTSEQCCSTTYPGTFSGDKGASWFGGSGYHFAWQFHIEPDYDIAYEPLYMPYFGFYWGS